MCIRDRVSYGEIDFQFRNDLDTPVYIMSWMDGVTLHVQFYGKHPKEWDTINVYSQTTSEKMCIRDRCWRPP